LRISVSEAKFLTIGIADSEAKFLVSCAHLYALDMQYLPCRWLILHSGMDLVRSDVKRLPVSAVKAKRCYRYSWRMWHSWSKWDRSFTCQRG